MGHNVNCSVLRGRHKCPYCQRGYMMVWAYENHVKVCPWKDKDKPKKPKRRI